MKKNFAELDKDKYTGIIGAKEAETTKATKATKKTKDISSGKNAKLTENIPDYEALGFGPQKRQYKRLNVAEEAPSEYKTTVRMPGEYGRFINELAYQRRSTISAEICRLIKEEMERRPDILESLDELNQ